MSARKVRLSVSKDGGHTDGNWREASLGEQGEYRKRVRFTRFGDSPQFIFTIEVTDPIRADLMGAVAFLESGN